MSTSATTDAPKGTAKEEKPDSRARGDDDCRWLSPAPDKAPESNDKVVHRKATFNWKKLNEALAKGGKKFSAIAVQLENPAVFIDAVRSGVPGEIVKSAIQTFGNDRELFVRLLGTSSSNLSRFYARKSLDLSDSEAVLDAIRILKQAADVFEDRGIALEWLQSRVPALAGARPLDLFDTGEGRHWVRATLRKIEFGEFT